MMLLLTQRQGHILKVRFVTVCLSPSITSVGPISCSKDCGLTLTIYGNYFDDAAQLTENVSATFLFGCIGVWLLPNVAKPLLKRFLVAVEALCWNQNDSNCY